TSKILGGNTAIDPITSRTVNGWQKIHPPVDVAISGKNARMVADELALRFDEIIPLPYMDFNDIRAAMTNGILRLMAPGYDVSRDQLYADMRTIERIMRRVSSMLLRHFIDDEEGIRHLLASDDVARTQEEAAAFFDHLYQFYKPGDGGIIDFIASNDAFDRGTAISNAFVLFEASSKSLAKIASNLLIQAAHNPGLFRDLKERNVTLHNAILASGIYSTSNDITFREATEDFKFENGQVIPAGSTIVLNLGYALRPYAKHLFISPTDHNISVLESFPHHHRYLPWLFRGNFPKDVPDRGCSGMAYSFQVISRIIDIITSRFEGIEIVSRPIDDISATRGYAVKFCLY
ncbi:MAG: cytochrome P450, partial [Chloroflexi bacterium]|nr:cytochrome P450 [Chloroflexota bacterium]